MILNWLKVVCGRTYFSLSKAYSVYLKLTENRFKVNQNKQLLQYKKYDPTQVCTTLILHQCKNRSKVKPCETFPHPQV